MHIAQPIIWRKNLEECDESLNYTDFENKYYGIFPMYVYCFMNDTMCMSYTSYPK